MVIGIAMANMCAALVLSGSAPTAPPVVPQGAVVVVGNSQGWHCSGVLIAPTVVLTAGHCTPATRVAFAGDVPAGSRRFKGQIPVASSLVRGRSGADDLALLVLGKPAPLGAAVAHLRWNTAEPAGKALAIGYGGYDRRRLRHQRRSLKFDIRGYGCNVRRRVRSGCNPAREMVILSNEGRDTCRGDSGGPMFLMERGRPVVMAITTRSLANANRDCGQGGVYVRVDAALPWIFKQLQLLAKSRRQ